MPETGSHTTAPEPPANPRPPTPPRDWRGSHLWQIQPVRDLLILAALLGVVYLGWVLSVVTVPLLLAIALAYLFEPLVLRITRSGRVSRSGAAMGILLFAFVVIVVPVTVGVGVGVLQGATYAQRVGVNVQNLVDVVKNPANDKARAALPPAWENLANRLTQLRAQAQRARQRAEDPASVFNNQRVGPPSPEEEAEIREELERDETAMQVFRLFESATGFIVENAQAIGQRALSTGVDALQFVFRWVMSLSMLVFGLSLTAFFFYFISTGWGRVRAFWESLIPERRRGVVIELLAQMDGVISGFIRGRLLICSIFIVYYTVGYWLIGAPVPLLLGPLVGALTLVPYAAAVGVPIVVLAMFLEPSDVAWQAEWWWIIGAPLGISLIGQQLLDDYILTPRIQGKATGMDTPTILFASLAGGVLAGFYGLLLAIPVAACIKILLKQVVWPKVRAWAEGRAPDPLPISRS